MATEQPEIIAEEYDFTEEEWVRKTEFLKGGVLPTGPVMVMVPPGTEFIPIDPRRRLEALRPAMEAMTAFFGTLSEQLRPVVAAMEKIALQLPQPPVRGRPRPLAADGLSYRHRSLARKRRSR